MHPAPQRRRNAIFCPATLLVERLYKALRAALTAWYAERSWLQDSAAHCPEPVLVAPIGLSGALQWGRVTNDAETADLGDEGLGLGQASMGPRHE